MDISFIIAMITTWLGHLFPSIAQYLKYLGTGIMVFISGLGIFTNLLPEPGRVYPVPDVDDLKAKLNGGGKFILKIAGCMRTFTIVVNWFLATAIYSWFYNFTNAISGVLCKVKLAPKPLPSSKTTGI